MSLKRLGIIKRCHQVRSVHVLVVWIEGPAFIVKHQLFVTDIDVTDFVPVFHAFHCDVAVVLNPNELFLDPLNRSLGKEVDKEKSVSF